LQFNLLPVSFLGMLYLHFFRFDQLPGLNFCKSRRHKSAAAFSF